MKLGSKPIPLKYFGLFKFEKIALGENKYVRCPMREIKSARKSARIRYT